MAQPSGVLSVGSKSYQNYRVTSVKEGRVGIIHDGGVASIPMTELSPEQLASLKAAAPALFEEYQKKLDQASKPKMPASPVSTAPKVVAPEPALPGALLSISEWRDRAKEAIGDARANSLGSARVGIEDSKDFFDAVGKPSAESQDGGYVMLAWKCRDGVVLMSVNAQIWKAQKILIVEDFQQSFSNPQAGEAMAELTLTVGEWQAKAREAIGDQRANALGSARVGIEESATLFDAVGKPSQEGQQGKFVVLTWKCTDGLVIMLLDSAFWHSKKMLIVEDFSVIPNK